MPGARMKKPGSSAFPRAAGVKMPSKRMAAGSAALGRKGRPAGSEGFKSRKMQMHPARRSGKNPKAMKARQRPVQKACCTAQPPSGAQR
ncbi:MAG: hypothetical protein LBU32_33150 [Clostridiales bacterium]|nr:hypothetical protein [Clostridiales bacterium]